MSNKTTCREAGFDYDCAIPIPRSAFEAGPLCAGLGEFLYEPANCDVGYWCGCRSREPSLCLPTNDTNNYHWGGHFTTTTDNGTVIVLTGLFGDTESKCPTPYYCPGRNNTFRCVDLCEPGMYCPKASQMVECPSGKFCPVGTAVPRECKPLEGCNDAGQRRFKTGNSAGLILLFLVLSIVYLYVGRRQLNVTARRHKESLMAAKRDNGNDDKEESEPSAVEEVAMNPPSSHRRSSISAAPQNSIDVEFDRLRLTLPNVGTIMRGVSGTLMHGTLTCIMGPSGAGKTTFLNLVWQTGSNFWNP